MQQQQQRDLWNSFYTSGRIADYLAYKAKAGDGVHCIENKNSNPRPGHSGNADRGK